MHIERRTITPEIALELLANNAENRRINEKTVKIYARAMKNGEWKLNGETIKFNSTRLIDGQHRLYACIEAEASFDTFVLADAPDEIFDSIDVGKIRRAGDILGMGPHREKNAALLAATIKIIRAYYANEDIRKTTYSVIEIENTLNERPDIRDFVNKTASFKSPVLPKSITAACYYIFDGLDHIKAAQFMAGLIDGIGLESGSPILVLRNKLIADHQATAKLPPKAKIAITIKAWNAFRTGKKIRQLNYRSGLESFPVAI